MDMKQLRTFVTVARLSSLTKAADALHITQPAVSNQLKALEESLEVRLIQRTTSAVSLTQAGQELLPKAERVLETFGDFLNGAKGLRGTIGGHLRLGVVMLDPECLKLGQFVRLLATNYRGVVTNLHVVRIAWMTLAIQSGELDGAFFVGRQPPPETRGLKLTRMTFRVVAPAPWRNRIEDASWSDAALMPWIRASQPSANHDMVTEILQRLAIKPVEIVEADHEFIIRTLVSAGVGIGILREELALRAQESNELIVMNERAETALWFIYHANRESDPAIQASVSTLANIWETDADS